MTEQDIKDFELTYTGSKIQRICVCWVRKTFPDVGDWLVAVPSGGWRGPKAAITCKYEGQVNGVADLILLYPAGGKSSLCIEMKVPKRKGSQAGKQSKFQVAWQSLVERYGSTYVVCHGLMEFIDAVCKYLRVNPKPYKEKALNLYPTYR